MSNPFNPVEHPKKRKSRLTGKESCTRHTVCWPKGQEEAICFSQDGKGYIILAEGKQSSIRYFHIP
jgi:hypothetical protein